MRANVIAALKSDGLLNESVGAGYIDRHWPPAFKDAGIWPLTSLRQSFLNGSLTRLIDPDGVLASSDSRIRRARRLWPSFRETVTEANMNGFGLPNPIGAEEVAFEAKVFPADEGQSGAASDPNRLFKKRQTG